LKKEREVSDTLAELYRLRSIRWPVDVTKVCGGCPADRFAPNTTLEYHVPVPAPISSVESQDHTTLHKTFPWLEASPAFVFFDDSPDLSGSLITFASWLVGDCGFKEIGLPSSSPLARLPAFHKLYRKASDGVLLLRTLDQLDEEPYSPLARLTILDSASSAHYAARVQVLQRPCHVILLPQGTRDQSNPHRLISDSAIYSGKLESLLAVLTQ
jgi:hypothetical protein